MASDVTWKMSCMDLLYMGHNMPWLSKASGDCWTIGLVWLSMFWQTCCRLSTVKTSYLPYVTCSWVGHSSILVAGHDCCPMLFNYDGAGRVTFVAKLDAEKQATAQKFTWVDLYCVKFIAIQLLQQDSCVEDSYSSAILTSAKIRRMLHSSK